ncbi:IS66 family insertion sequence element accessory protein TnpA [Alicyclobacillus vulcanalis]|uniref:IS66 family insertion sequence element accessory protein TnpA n=1 Tax=Alicyclobacillus vulcanalis TaxID=252246 RepID=UPI0038991E2D
MSHPEHRELWRERIAAFYDSGLSASQFCAEHGLKPHQLRYWLRRLRNETLHDSHLTSTVGHSTYSRGCRILLRRGLSNYRQACSVACAASRRYIESGGLRQS